MEISNPEITIGAIVAGNYKAASVFRKYGIDFCCKGNRTIAQACEGKALVAEDLMQEVTKALATATSTGTDFTSWPLDLLADYIQKIHHSYVTHKTPELRAYLDKINKVHGDRHPELGEVLDLFVASTNELLQHMEKEENILFPYIRILSEAERSGATPTPPPFGSIQNPINAMMHEHEHEGERFARIAEITDNHTPPADACATYKVAFANLQAFEADLHTHIHLENNILFPKAIALEKELMSVPANCSL